MPAFLFKCFDGRNEHLGVDQAGGHIQFATDDSEGNSGQAVFLSPCRHASLRKFFALSCEEYDKAMLNLSAVPIFAGRNVAVDIADKYTLCSSRLGHKQGELARTKDTLNNFFL